MTALIAGTAMLGLAGCKKEHDPAKLKGDNVLFITLDTTRADRLGCYGYEKAQTPTLDALAAGGTLFEQAYTQAPLTLPSHCTMMTGLYPREHGVRDNGAEKLSDHATLARLFKQNGYRTGGFVAAFVLDDHYGIGQGFDEYNDDMGGRKAGENPLEAQQPGDVVTDRVLAWLKSSTDKPFFCWVHYYDPHDPYAPPPDFASPDRDPYDGEISFMDSQIKRLIDWLAAEKLLESTMIVAVGDHGESFDEHGERGHTNFTYETNLHVPLIFVHPEVIPAGRRVGVLAELVDLYPTMLELFGWRLPHPVMSRSLVPALLGEDMEDRDVYSETLYVLRSYGWAEQRSLTTREWKYISSTKPELYDRRADPGEMKNLVLDRPRIAADLYEALRGRWGDMVPGEAERANLSPEKMAQLQSLGYLGGGASDGKAEQFLTPGLADPKDNLKVAKLLGFARALMERAYTPHDFRMAIPLLRDVVQMAPKSVNANFMYASALLNANQPADALRVVDYILHELGTQEAQTLQLKAEALRALGRLEEAIKEYEAALLVDERAAFAHDGLAAVLTDLGRTSEAIAHARKTIAIDPSAPVGHARLTSLLTDPAELQKAVEDFEPLIGNDRDDARWRWRLSQALTRLGRGEEAFLQLKKAVELDPEFVPARVTLGGAYLGRGEFESARTMFRPVAEGQERPAEGLYYLGLVAAKEGKLDEAAHLLEKSLALDISNTQGVLELAVVYRRAGQLEQMVKVLSRGVESSPDSPVLNAALGQVLATTQQDKLRDCPRAAILLEKASKAAAGRDPLVLANLAAAYACLGRYDDAVKTVESGLSLGDEVQRERLEEQLELHRQGRPYVDSRL